ncbi:Pyrimidine-specific ribonucleoside hydrolase rihA [Anaerotruncus sp. 2789STDY5834896]|uniref:Pyrimidine-specific ribonucleoside hydrolase rihA n=1 Tax=uncultured Anaerotruncus sp. TaxID=905011 RepID=A0A1C6HID5_9FIRM|nr:Pyrimidine-specific ribonucleoside hydrolase rihA [uncultured Anaerotruncus sp.]
MSTRYNPNPFEKKKMKKSTKWVLCILAAVSAVGCIVAALVQEPVIPAYKEAVPVIIDCDPGTDDGYALVMAGGTGNLDVRGITTVYGALSIGATTQNALSLTDYIGLGCPVSVGAATPLVRSLLPSSENNGVGGLCSVALPVPAQKLDERPAWQLIYDEAVAQNGKLQLICLGPLTNVATALQQYPDLAQKLAGITFMAGNFDSPAVEFNTSCDPQALDVVLRCGVPLTVVPRDRAYLATRLINPCPVADSDGNTALWGTGSPDYWSDLVSDKSPVQSFLVGVQQYTDDNWKTNDQTTSLNCRAMPSMAPLLSVISGGSDLCRYDKCWVNIITTGEKTGTVVFTSAQNAEKSDEDLGAEVSLLVDIDRTLYRQAIRQMVDSYR